MPITMAAKVNAANGADRGQTVDVVRRVEIVRLAATARPEGVMAGPISAAKAEDQEELLFEKSAESQPRRHWRWVFPSFLKSGGWNRLPGRFA
jgi:hypothetical protein